MSMMLQELTEVSPASSHPTPKVWPHYTFLTSFCHFYTSGVCTLTYFILIPPPKILLLLCLFKFPFPSSSTYTNFNLKIRP